ncbi:MAG: hypothetical protein ACRDD3_05620 [Azovibrio sp.]
MYLPHKIGYLAMLFMTPCAIASSFSITTDFSHQAEGIESGGGFCAGYFIGKKIQYIAGINEGKKIPLVKDIFIKNIECMNVGGPTNISIDNIFYEITPVNEHNGWFAPKYENINKGVVVHITDVKEIASRYDEVSRCTSSYKKVKVTVEFKGEKQVINAVAGGVSSCPDF